MKKLVLLVLSSLVLILTACGTSENEGDKKVELSNKEKAVALIKSLETGDHEPVSYINPDKYIQHNLMAKDGLEGFSELLSHVPEGSIKANVIRAYSDGDYVFTHTDYNFFGPKAGFDIFRFENGLIVEHWDNLQDRAENLNPSGHTQFDGPAEAKELNKTEVNKAIVREFLNTVIIEHQFEKMNEYFDGDNYIQHNSMVPDGVSGLMSAMEEMSAHGMDMVIEKVHMVLGEGNYVLCVSEGTFGGNHTSFYDLFRLENGKIAEHWDVIETILPKEQWQNENGKY